MGTMTIWISSELKARMDNHKEIDWSKVACDAFEAAILREERKQSIREKKSLSDSR